MHKHTTLSARDQEVIWHPYTQMKTAGLFPAIVKGEGVYLIDDTGKHYLDAISSWWVNLHGHAHPYLAQKLYEQAMQLQHSIFAGFTHEPAVTLAERLLRLLGKSQTKLFYSDNGSTAVEVALKMAVQFWHNQGEKRTKLIVLEHSYHGDTVGAMSVSARSAFTNAFESLLFDVLSIPVPFNGDEQHSFDTLRKIVSQERGNLAAFLFEPLVLGSGGMLMYEAGALDELLRICKEENILCIADEVMTGFGRTGKLFAKDHLTEQADIICLSKGLTGGSMALGVTSCTEEVYRAFLSDDKLKTFFHGHSYTANPLACAIANASLDLLLQDTCQDAIQNISQQLKEMKKKLENLPGIENVRSCGTILAFDVVTKEDTHYFNALRDTLYTYFVNNGILLRPLGNTLYLMPPYIITAEELNTIYTAIENYFLQQAMLKEK